MKSRKLVFLLVVLMLFTFLTGCNSDIEPIANTENEEVDIDYLIVEGGQVVLPLTPFNTLNPLMTSNLSYYYFSKLIYEGLYEFNDSLEPTPQLAESHTILDDGKTVLVKLREDVYWHDGEKFTTEDVMFTINVLSNSKLNTAYNDNISYFKSISANVIDDYNIELRFEVPSGNVLESLTFPIIPSHQFIANKANDRYAMALQLEGYSPIGTGPFKFINYDKYKSIELEAYENYRFGKPSIANVIGKVLNNNELFITAFEAGQINITPVTGVDWDKHKESSRIKILEYVSNDYEFLAFNFNNPIFSGENGSVIRKAINYGINRQEIIQKIYLGHATQTDVPLHPNSWLLSEEANHYGYNPATGRELLTSSGLIDVNGDGILEDQEGNKISFSLVTNPTNLYRFRVAEMIREDLKEIGIEIVLAFDTSYERDIELEDKMNEWDELNEKITSGKFDIALLGWQLSLIPDLNEFFHSNQIGQNNIINYNNEVMDTLLLNVDNSFSKESRITSYNEIQKYIIDDLPYVSLFLRNKAILIDTKIRGELSPNIFNPYKGLEKCFIALDSE
ncbi:peptide ABC transporter substrate-binding protein [Tissierella sp. Yu-01]|uniref:peptide ABC transporter substrate-binding protein n=1 Tax=Tissierella sp. Yu-01 TaxID=3035694 RepID=UPI00240D7849|nr:peptide ABC transporter substrate-binding protein [Tissierella sp. Yu-01]WFA09477.1 peptide ABC transporter substrate-binding protein [Tissierella sp. Yu-01]